jgi:hypothetical protein
MVLSALASKGSYRAKLLKDIHLFVACVLIEASPGFKRKILARDLISKHMIPRTNEAAGLIVVPPNSAQNET